MKYHKHLMFLAVASAALGAFSKAYADVDENLVIAENTDADLGADTAASLPPSYGADAGGILSIDAGPPLTYSVENSGAAYSAAFPDFDHLPIVRPLPDTFRFFDGSRSTDFADWEERRNEILASIEKYEIGPKPGRAGHPSIPNSAITVTATWIPPGPTSTGAFGPNAGKLVVTVRRPSNGKVVTISTSVWRPAGYPAGTKFAAIIPMAGGTSATGANASYGGLPTAVMSARAVGTVAYPHNSTTTYLGSGTRANDPFYQMYPELSANVATSNSGMYAAWTWGVSRLIDGMEIAAAANPSFPIDTARLAVVGCSYAGKMALFSGALDERIAVTFPMESGGGGAPAWRIGNEIDAYRVTETITHTDYGWFASQMRQFSWDNVYKLPHDHHELSAMVAPRALMQTNNASQQWLSDKAFDITSRAVQRTYDAFGIGDRFGFIVDTNHGHCAVPTSQNQVFAGFVDKFLLGNASANTDWHINVYGPSLDYQRWTAWWGTLDPKFPNNWSPDNGTVVMKMDLNQPIAAGSPVMAGYALAMPGSHDAAALTLKGARMTVDVVNPDGRSYILRWPPGTPGMAVTLVNNSVPEQSYSIPADDNSWFSSTEQAVVAGPFDGVATTAYLNVLGSQATWTGTGNIAGPGVVGTPWNPIAMKFHVNGASSGAMIVSRGPKINSVAASPGLLGLPSGQMVPVTVTVNAQSDLVGDSSPGNPNNVPAPAISSRIVGVTCNQPIVAGVDYTPAVLPATGTLLTVNLKCASTGPGPGRIYTLLVETTDNGASATGAVAWSTLNKSYSKVTVTAAPLPLGPRR